MVINKNHIDVIIKQQIGDAVKVITNNITKHDK